MATIKDVARAAGVSTATVSRVLNDHPSVTAESRERVLAAVERLAYHPNAAARTLRSADVTTLGLVIGDVLNPFFTELARAVEDEARAHGYYVITGNADEDPRRQDEYLDILLEQRVAGLLLCPTDRVSPLVEEVVRRGRPIVLIDRSIDGLDLPVVRSDNATATRELVDHLVALGHRRIAIISGPTSLVTGRERLAAFRAALAAHGLEVADRDVRIGDFQTASGVAAMGELMERPDPPTAVFAADNLMALGALRWVRDRGLRPGSDIGLASFDDLPWFEFVDPPITAVRQQTEEMGRAAVRELIALLNGRPARSRTLPCQLVIRGSCGERQGAQ
ncbi:LacI family DNA-binding transcriptional regulator [Marinactinospora thermotolerans]|uniref:Transcriptional regulator, LacI family n=1 Tax=Marinactinospora thermotolerans DSM 45154 TaxID=1122192 RepID=A0A1T4JXR3_9ACTN|nr:LacI family DNA-binding transcriptional regulator [Marinactinospora thermotolerans]SJZ34899.1 transcriptional regulator, LacI family [Marinactinospora thermotolerans DSM 45154]